MVWKLAALVVLCGVHLWGHRLGPQGEERRLRWLSFGAGVSVAYVFLMLLPELDETADRVGAEGWLRPFYEHPHFVALLGLLLFYGLARMIRLQSRGPAGDISRFAFAVDIGSFMLYNAVIGHLITDKTVDLELFWYALAMMLHFLVVDRGLRENHGERFHTLGRWLLAAAIPLGFSSSYITPLMHELTPLLTAFLGGGVILNTLKDEVPDDRESHFGFFCAGAFAYAVVLFFA